MHLEYNLHELVSFHDALLLLPKRNGKEPHVSTLYRWKAGLRGKRLWATRIGGIFYTHPNALKEFQEALAPGAAPHRPEPIASDRAARTADVLERVRRRRGERHARR